MDCKVTGRARAHLPREEKIDTNDPRCQWWESLKPAPLPGVAWLAQVARVAQVAPLVLTSPSGV